MAFNAKATTVTVISGRAMSSRVPVTDINGKSSAKIETQRPSGRERVKDFIKIKYSPTAALAASLYM